MGDTEHNSCNIHKNIILILAYRGQIEIWKISVKKALSSLQPPKKLANTNCWHKHTEQEQLISTVINDTFTTVHLPAFQNTHIFLTEATLSCSQIMYTDIFVAELMAEITAMIISVEQ